jgi:hypothetical protein
MVLPVGGRVRNPGEADEGIDDSRKIEVKSGQPVKLNLQLKP